MDKLRGGCKIRGEKNTSVYGSREKHVVCIHVWRDARIPRRVLVLGEPRAAPIGSEWAGALQRGRGTGGEVVRKCGLGC